MKGLKLTCQEVLGEEVCGGSFREEKEQLEDQGLLATQSLLCKAFPTLSQP